MSRSAESDSFWNMRAFKGYLPLNVEEVRANSARSSSENAGRGGGVKSSSPPGALSWKGSCILSGALASLLTMAILFGIGGAHTRGGGKPVYGPPMNGGGDWALDGGPSRYPTDFLRDVVPVPCHSHNDYWRERPLVSALRAGCVSVEADVWLFGEDERSSSSNDPQHQPPHHHQPLLVGHDPAALTADRTFTSLYVDPLVALLTQMNPRMPYVPVPYGADGEAEVRRGVFDADPAQSLILLVDIKTGGPATWERVLRELEPLRARGWLTRWEEESEDGSGAGGIRPGPVTVVGTGNAPFDLLTQNATYRDAFFDAPLGDMFEDEDGGRPSGAVSDHFDRTNSFYASTSFRQAVGPVVRGALSEDQLRTIRGQIRGAHRRGLLARYWDTPSWPLSLRNEVWRVLVEEGADMLNVDDLYAATQSVW